jgi:hypothetical protein
MIKGNRKSLEQERDRKETFYKKKENVTESKDA